MIPVLYEDESVLVVDKPAGMAVHPSPGYETGTMTDELAASRPALRRVGSAERPGVVHRLDVETSGVMVFAKTADAYRKLRAAFESHVGVRKTYLAVLHGAPKAKRGTCAAPIDGKRAVSHWETLGRQGDLALVEFRIETGRTHQIRLHAKALGHPVVGDRIHGDAATRTRAKRLLLHAVELAFVHPVTGRELVFSVPPPEEIVYAK